MWRSLRGWGCVSCLDYSDGFRDVSVFVLIKASSNSTLLDMSNRPRYSCLTKTRPAACVSGGTSLQSPTCVSRFLFGRRHPPLFWEVALCSLNEAEDCPKTELMLFKAFSCEPLKNKEMQVTLNTQSLWGLLSWRILCARAVSWILMSL